MQVNYSHSATKISKTRYCIKVLILLLKSSCLKSQVRAIKLKEDLDDFCQPNLLIHDKNDWKTYEV